MERVPKNSYYFYTPMALHQILVETVYFLGLIKLLQRLVTIPACAVQLEYKCTDTFYSSMVDI
jgi:hypothetical protein